MDIINADGYQMNDFLQDVKVLVQDQLSIRRRLGEIDIEIDTMPKIPSNSEVWISSLPDLDSKVRGFSIADFKKITKLRKEYMKLKEREDINLHKLKTVRIDGLIAKINLSLDKPIVE